MNESRKIRTWKIKIKSQSFNFIESYYKVIKKKIFKTRICLFLDLPRRTLNHKIKNNTIYLPRKIRSDSKVDSAYFTALVNKVYEDNYGTSGGMRIHCNLIEDKVECSLSTVHRIMQKCNLYAAEVTRKPRVYEAKDTSINVPYLFTKENIALFQPNTAFAADLSLIKTRDGDM